MPKPASQEPQLGPLTSQDIERLLQTPGSTLQKILGIQANQIWSQRLLELTLLIQESHKQIQNDLALWKSQINESPTWGLPKPELEKIRMDIPTVEMYKKEAMVLFSKLENEKEKLTVLVADRDAYVNALPSQWRDQRTTQVEALSSGLVPILDEMFTERLATERTQNPNLSAAQVEQLARIYQISAEDQEVLTKPRKAQEIMLMPNSPAPADAAPEALMVKSELGLSLAVMQVLGAKEQNLSSPYDVQSLKPSDVKKMQAGKTGIFMNKKLKEFRVQDIAKMMEQQEAILNFDNRILEQDNIVEDLQEKLSKLSEKINLKQNQLDQLQSHIKHQRPSA